jgi:uncharacterized protein YbjT (DUF2867 family)
VRALVRREDDRAQKLRDLGAEVIVADMLRLKEVPPALDGVDGAYLCYPLADGLVEVTAVFAMHATQVDAGGGFWGRIRLQRQHQCCFRTDFARVLAAAFT